MKKILNVIMFLTVVVIGSPVQAITCPEAPKPKLNFSMKKAQTKFDFSKSVDQLSRENSSINNMGPGWVNEGIMSSKFPNYQISASMKGVKYPGTGQACYWVDEINFLWVFQPTIYIAKEYKKGSCKYNVIIDHERQHVEIDIRVLTKYRDYIKRALQKISAKPIETGLIRETQKPNLLGSIEKTLQPLIDKMVGERTRRQSAIDTVEEYTRIGNLCKDRR